LEERIFIGLGANLGDRLMALRRALSALNAIAGVEVISVSSLYETEPVGVRQQPDFLNAVAELRSRLEPEALLRVAQEVEHRMGRRRIRRWGPRSIDIDLLLWGDRVIASDELSIPHPEMKRRNFVLVPLAEIAPEVEFPLQRVTIAALLEQSPDPGVVRKVAPPDVLWHMERREVGVAP